MCATFREHILSEEEETSIEEALWQLGATFANVGCKHFLVSADKSAWRIGGEKTVVLLLCSVWIVGSLCRVCALHLVLWSNSLSGVSIPAYSPWMLCQVR